MKNMTDNSDLPETPNIGLFIVHLLMGMYLGLFPALLFLFASSSSLSDAAILMALLVGASLLYYLMGWAIFVAPFLIIRWIWRKLTDTMPPPAEPEPPQRPQHWITRAAFWSGVLLTTLLSLRVYFVEAGT